MYALVPMPATEDTLLLFIAYLHRQGLSVSSVSMYLASVRALHVNNGYGNPLVDCLRVQKALRSLEMNGPKPKQKLPITLDVLERFLPHFNSSGHSLCVLAAMTLAFFGCLRASELTVGSHFDPSKHVTNEDVVFSDYYVSVLVKTSKTDKRNSGFHVTVGCSNHRICCFCAMKAFRDWKVEQKCQLGPNEPFFAMYGAMLTKDVFQKETRLKIALIGMNPKDYSGHSFRSGSATTAAMAGLTDWEIKLLGRWTSDAYQRYIRAPVTMPRSFASRMVNTSGVTPFSYRNPYITNVFL